MEKKQLLHIRHITDKITKVFSAGNSLNGYTTIQGIYVGKFPGDEELFRNSLKTILEEEKLETLDKVRDEILKTPGNTALSLENATDADVKKLFTSIRRAAKTSIS